MVEYLITFFIGFLASIISGVAGGGAGLITVPLFIFMGIPPASSIATAKFGGLGLTLGAFSVFRKTNLIRWEYVLYLSLLTVVASVMGSLWLLSINQEVVENIIGVTMLGSLPFLFLKKETGLARSVTSFTKKIIGSVLYFVITVLKAAFGGGIGTAHLIIMMNLFGFTALEANATRKLPGIIAAIVTLSVFVLNDIVYYKHGFAIFLGACLGSVLGAKIAIYKGNFFVKGTLCALLICFAVKLLFF